MGLHLKLTPLQRSLKALARNQDQAESKLGTYGTRMLSPAGRLAAG